MTLDDNASFRNKMESAGVQTEGDRYCAEAAGTVLNTALVVSKNWVLQMVLLASASLLFMNESVVFLSHHDS